MTSASLKRQCQTDRRSLRHYLSQHRKACNRSEPESAKSGCCAVKPLPEEPDDLIAWHDSSPKQFTVISAVVLRGERANRGKQRVLRALVQLADGQIHFLSLTHAAPEIRSLLEVIGRHLIGTSKQPLSSAWPGSLQTEHADCAPRFLDEDPCNDAAWDLENWRRQHTVELVREHSRLPPGDIAARANTDLDQLRRQLDAVRDQFLAALDQDILHAAGYPALLDVKRYNYMAHPDPNIRRNRRQAVTAFPLLIEEILSRAGPTSLAIRIDLAIDSGEKLIEMLSRTLGVKPAAVRILRNLPVTEAGSRWYGKLPSLLGLLSTIPPERYPRTPDQWLAFNSAIQFVKSATGYPVDSTFTGIVLDDMARRNWLPDAHFSGCLLEQARCIETLTRDLGRALAAFVRVQHGGDAARSFAEAHAAALNVLIRLGVRKASQLAGKWIALKSKTDLSSPGRGAESQFPVLLPAPFRFQDLTIVQLASQSELSAESACLGHCVETYGPSCMNGNSIICSVRGATGLARSTVELSVIPRGLTEFEIRLVQHKGHNNVVPDSKDKAAVSALVDYLCSNDAIRFLQEFSRVKFLASIEPELARDYRLIAPMEVFLPEATHGRISFANICASLAKEEAPDTEQKSHQSEFPA